MTSQPQIKNSIPYIQYLGDKKQKEFFYPFYLFKKEDLHIYFDTTLQKSGYTISRVGAPDGGTVVFDTAPDEGVRITLVRHLKLERITDFQESGLFRTSVINQAFDYHMACIQQIAHQLKRTLHMHVSLSAIQMQLPSPQKGHALVWNDTEDGLTNSSIDVVAHILHARDMVAAINKVYQQISDLFHVSPGAGYAGLINNLFGILQKHYPEDFISYGYMTEVVLETIDYGWITEEQTEQNDHGHLYL